MIDTQQKLEANIESLKIKFENSGAQPYQLYPLFSLHYDRNKENYQMPNEIIKETAFRILVEENENEEEKKQ